MDNFAPVLIPTLCRHEHFKRCVESLSLCIHADKTDLYIAFDYPLKDAHWDGYRKIEKYIPEINGFKSVTIIKRDVNYGAVKNFFDPIAEIFKKYDRLIVSEDDNVFAPSFLKFVNKGLIIYENRPDIFSVSGYNYPFTIPSFYRHDAYLITAFTAWGVGLWRDKWNQVDWSWDNFNVMLSKKENYKNLKRNYQIYLPQLFKVRDSGVITADGVLFLNLLDKNMYSLLPVKTMVRNTGHDGSGEHCGYSTTYINQKVYEGLEDIRLPPDLQPDKKLLDLFLKHIQLPFKVIVVEKIKRLIPAPLLMRLRRIIKNK